MSEEIFFKNLLKEHQQALSCPSRTSIVEFFETSISLLFPDYGDIRCENENDLNSQFQLLKNKWDSIVNQRCKEINDTFPAKADHFDLIKELSLIKSLLEKDVQAIYDGDPAAKNSLEIIKTYPGFKAISAYRMAHLLYENGYVLIARVIAEYAHATTGIDIHPAAKIGEHFCIDHGTGIVVGETCDIGHHVKIYQGVTLGAKSVRKEFASKKRHPTIGNHVVIYANSTILGGDTIIGDNSIVGGNSWITESLAEGSTYQNIKN